MLQFQIQQAPMRFGLAEGVEPRQTPFGTLMTAENACWTKTGVLGKRLGSTALSTDIVGGGNLSSAKRLIVRGNELALTDGTTLYSRTSAGWVDRGRHPELGLEWSTITDPVNGVSSCDVAYLSNGQIVEAWVVGDPSVASVSNGNLYYQIRDYESGVVITPPTLVGSSAATPAFRLLASGTTWVLVYCNVNGLLNAVTSTGLTTLQDDVGTTGSAGGIPGLDACVIGSEFVVAYVLSSGGIQLHRYSFAGTPVLQASATVTGESATHINTISVGGAEAETLYIAYQRSGTGFFFAAADPSSLAQTVAPTSVESTDATTGSVALVRETSTSCVLAYSHSGSTFAAGITRTKSITNAGAITAGQSTQFLQVLSRPFLIGSRFYCVLGTYTQATSFSSSGVITASDTFIADITQGQSVLKPFRQVGKIDALIGGVWAPGFVANPIEVSSTLTILPIGYQSSPPTGRVGVRQGARLVRCTSGDDRPADMFRSVCVDEETYIASGVLTAYDGVDTIGYGLPFGPYLDSSNMDTATTPGAMASGNYIYNVTAERRSAVGVLHRSPVGIPITMAVTGPTGNVTVAIVLPSFGRSASIHGEVVVYRTTVGGTVLHRLSIDPVDGVLDDGSLTSYPVTVPDSAADGAIGPSGLLTLGARPALYTTGGELEDTQPPSCLTLAWHQSRLWCLVGDGTTVWLSKDASSNPGIAPGFYSTQILTFESTVTAMCSLDEKLIVYGENTFWLVVGQGPAPNGQSSSYEVSSVQTDVGCTNPRSLVSTPDGHMFQSERGIYLLARDLSLVWIGRAIKDKLAAYPNITSAVLVAKRNEVRFTTSNSDLSESIVLVYNYVEKQWSTAKYTVGEVYGAPIVDACMFNGAWTFVTADGVVVQETEATYLDGTAWVPLTIETAWNNAGGPLAFQSVRNFSLEGVSNSDHDLTISVGFDNETAYVQTKTFAAGTPVTEIGPLESCTISIGTRRKCQAIRFKIQDAEPAPSDEETRRNSGQGPSFDMLGIEVGIKKGFATKSAMNTG